MKKDKEKATKILCKYCLKRKVCKYAEDFQEVAEKIAPKLEIDVFKINCTEFIDYRIVSLRR